MTFFETNPAATVEDAMHAVMWSAQRPNDRYYQEGTAQKAFSIVRGRQGGGSGNPATGVAGGVSILADTLKVVTKSLAGIAGKVANVEAMVKKREAATDGPTDAAGNDGPAGETGKKTSATCQKCCDVKPRESFSVTQWGNAASKMKCKACCDAVSWKAKLQRQCAQCKRAKGRGEYSAAQWTAKSGRCKACVGGSLEINATGEEGVKESLETHGGKGNDQLKEAGAKVGNQLAGESNVDEMTGVAEEIDVPGDGGCLFHSLALEQWRIEKKSGQLAGRDLAMESIALRQAVNGANRIWIAGLGEDEKLAAQWMVEGEMIDDGGRPFTTWDDYFRYMDNPYTFGGYFSIAGFQRLMEGRIGVNVWARTTSGYRLQVDARNEGYAKEAVAHLLFVGRNHYMVLRNPPKVWQLQGRAENESQGRTGLAIEQQVTRTASGTGAHGEVDGGTESRGGEVGEELRGEVPSEGAIAKKKKAVGRPCKETKKCEVCGVEKLKLCYSNRQWRQRSSTCGPCASKPSALPERQRVCVQCKKGKKQGAYSGKQWETSTIGGAKCRECCDANRPEALAGKRCAQCQATLAKTLFSEKQWGLPQNAARKCIACTVGLMGGKVAGHGEVEQGAAQIDKEPEGNVGSGHEVSGEDVSGEPGPGAGAEKSGVVTGAAPAIREAGESGGAGADRTGSTRGGIGSCAGTGERLIASGMERGGASQTKDTRRGEEDGPGAPRKRASDIQPASAECAICHAEKRSGRI